MFNKKYLKFIINISLFSLAITLLGSSSLSNKVNTKYISSNNDEKSKIAYLTFDDGPSKNTGKILDILKENDIKATFFIVGPLIAEDIEFTKRANLEGHTIGNHTYDHDYEDIYISHKAFWSNFDKSQALIELITGKPCKIFRFPGGSFNRTVKKAHGKQFIEEIKNELKEKEINYYDWNVDSGDGLSDHLSPNTIYNNIINSIKDKQNVIILMHDSIGKKSTVEALPQIIKYLKDNDYTFKGLDSI